MSEQKKDTSPLTKARRIKRLVQISEEHAPPSSRFDRSVEYPSDDLPEWFAGLQSIVEDEMFTSMEIRINGGEVFYHISILE